MHRVTFDPENWLTLGVAIFDEPKSLADSFTHRFHAFRPESKWPRE